MNILRGVNESRVSSGVVLIAPFNPLKTVLLVIGYGQSSSGPIERKIYLTNCVGQATLWKC